MSNYPQHITNIVAELQFGYEAEDVLQRHVSLINKDTQLYNLYTELSFDTRINSLRVHRQTSTHSNVLRNVIRPRIILTGLR
jgi:hypothetical protein